MLEKLSLVELVRYLFSGFAVAVAIGLARDVTVTDVVEWIKQNDWASHFSPTAIGALLLLVIGYYSFTIYRTLGYEWIVLPVKGGLAKLPGFGSSFYSYRELIRETVSPQTISVWEAERIYRVVRRRIAPEFYGESMGRITTGLHFLYFTALVLIISFACAGRLWGTVGSMLVFLLVLAFDVYFEREELLYFLAKRSELQKELAAFQDHPAWRSRDI